MTRRVAVSTRLSSTTTIVTLLLVYSPCLTGVFAQQEHSEFKAGYQHAVQGLRSLDIVWREPTAGVLHTV